MAGALYRAERCLRLLRDVFPETDVDASWLHQSLVKFMETERERKSYPLPLSNVNACRQVTMLKLQICVCLRRE